MSKLHLFGNVFEYCKKSGFPAGLGSENGVYPFFTSSDKLSKKINSFIYDSPSLIFGTGGKASVHYCDAKFNTSTDCIVAKPINYKETFPKYIYYYLRKNFHLIENGFKGAGLKHISKDYISKLKVPLPTLLEQKRIAEILDKADSIRIKRKESISLLDEFLRSVFLDMFGDPVRNEKEWEMKTLRELSDHIVDCPHSTPIHSSRITQFPCIRTTELRNGYIDWSRMKYVEKEVYDERTKRLIPKEGDIVFGREGTFGGAVRIPGNTTICLGQRVMLFRPNKAFVNSIFLWNLIRSKSIFQQATKKSTGSTVSHVNVKDIVKFKGICPPLNLQAQFAKIVEQVEATKAKMEESLREMDNQFNGLLQRAFGGRNIEN